MEGGLQQLAALHGLHHGLLRDRRQQPVGIQAQAPVRGAPLGFAVPEKDIEVTRWIERKGLVP